MQLTDLQQKLEDSFPGHSNQLGLGLRALTSLNDGILMLSALGVNVHLEWGPADPTIAEYPKMVYKNGEWPKLVDSAEAHEALGAGWDAGPDFEKPHADEDDSELVRMIRKIVREAERVAEPAPPPPTFSVQVPEAPPPEDHS